MDEQTIFDWRLFLPQHWPHQLLTGVDGTAQLSSLFIWLIIFSFSLVLGWLAWRGLKAFRSIHFLEQILRQVDPAKLPQQRRDLRQAAARRPYEGRLWLDFDASWVESSDGKRLYQTSDAAQFFNPASLTWGIAGNRLLGAMPGILTAFGILGTFMGLQIGLSTLDLSSPQVLSQSIVPLIQGSAVAFATSVWGTFASVVFNFLEKSAEQTLRKRVSHLQQRADALIPRHLPEQTLVNIERANQEAELALKGLAEQIGQQMQKALVDVPTRIQAGIEASMRPAVERLVEAAESLARKQGDSSQEGLARLIEQFVASVNQSGENSRQGLETATSQLSSSIAEWSQGMSGFLQRLDQRAGDFDHQISGMLEQGKHLREETSVSQQFLANVAGELHRGGELLQQSSHHLQQFGQELARAAQQLGGAQSEVAKLADASTRKQHEVTKLLAQIAQSLDQANDGLRGSSQSLQESASLASESFNKVSQVQQEFLDSLRKTLLQLRKQVGEMMQDYATDVEQQTQSRMEQWNAQTQEFAKGMVAAVNAMSEILGEIDSVLTQRRD